MSSPRRMMSLLWRVLPAGGSGFSSRSASGLGSSWICRCMANATASMRSGHHTCLLPRALVMILESALLPRPCRQAPSGLMQLGVLSNASRVLQCPWMGSPATRSGPSLCRCGSPVRRAPGDEELPYCFRGHSVWAVFVNERTGLVPEQSPYDQWGSRGRRV